VAAGADIDELVYGHDLLHMYGRTARRVVVDELVPLDGTERAAVATAVLTEMGELLDAALAGAEAGSRDDGGELAVELEGLFAELAPCIPEALASYQRRTGLLDAWLEQRPEVLTALLEATMTSKMAPYDLLEALLRWTAELDPVEREELHRRFAAEPASVITEALARAELAAELEDLDPGALGELDGPTP
jgi:hypothetical protein